MEEKLKELIAEYKKLVKLQHDSDSKSESAKLELESDEIYAEMTDVLDKILETKRIEVTLKRPLENIIDLVYSSYAVQDDLISGKSLEEAILGNIETEYDNRDFNFELVCAK